MAVRHPASPSLGLHRPRSVLLPTAMAVVVVLGYASEAILLDVEEPSSATYTEQLEALDRAGAGGLGHHGLP